MTHPVDLMSVLTLLQNQDTPCDNCKGMILYLKPMWTIIKKRTGKHVAYTCSSRCSEKFIKTHREMEGR